MSNVFYCKPILFQLRWNHPQCSCAAPRNFPKAAMRIEQEPGTRVRVVSRSFEDLLDVPKLIDEIRTDNEVKLLVEVERMNIRLYELDLGVPLASKVHHNR